MQVRSVSLVAAGQERAVDNEIDLLGQLLQAQGGEGPVSEAVVGQLQQLEEAMRSSSAGSSKDS